jgi:hypothetical protein
MGRLVCSVPVSLTFSLWEAGEVADRDLAVVVVVVQCSKHKSIYPLEVIQ